MSFSEVQPRHVLCFLGREGRFLELCRMIQSAIDNLAPGFVIDKEFSQDMPDDRMARSFEVSWDRVHKAARTEEDERAVLEHGCVIYVVGPHMDAEDTVGMSTIALRLITYSLANGAIAAKGESAGVAHGVARWTELGHDVEHAKEDFALARLCRFAFSRRPLDDGEFLCSVGFHLVGLPEVFVPRSLSNDDLVLTSTIDRVADEIFAEGIPVILARYGAVLLSVDDYDEDDFKYNPYGAIYLNPGIAADFPID